MGRSLVVEADGGSRSNPGVAGYGAVVRDADSGDLLAERAEPLGKTTNNVAEYRGLIAGLQAAAEVDPGASVHVRMDSNLVVQQMSGHWKIKHANMRPLAAEAQQLVQALRDGGGGVDWTWIPREENTHADRLSNDGMDGKTVRRDPWRKEPPASSAPAQSTAGPAHAAAAQANAPGRAIRIPPADLGAPATVLLVRHGVTDFTVQHRLDGRGGADPPLNAEGRAQVERTARALADRVTGTVVVCTSSLARAQQTGEVVSAALRVQPQVECDWDEQCFGVWDGLTFKEIQQQSPGGLMRLRTEERYAVDGGESHHDLVVRVQRAFRRAVDQAGPGGTVVVATHRKPIMVVLAGLLDISMERSWMLEADPASVTEVRMWQDRHASVSHVNDTAHLRQGM